MNASVLFRRWKQVRRPICFIVGGTLLALLLLAAGTFIWWTQIYVPGIRAAAEQKWAEIGRSMPEFEKRLSTVAENNSLRTLMRDLEPFGVSTLYKINYGEQDPNRLQLPKEITDALTGIHEGDEVKAVNQDFAYLSEHKADLEHLYQGILKRDAPVWRIVPEDGIALRTPNFQAARVLSQLILADALHKLECHDERGAADAIAAGLKMTSNVGKQPILVSLMISTAIEGLLTEAVARLPADSTALKRLAKDVDERREQWRTAIQAEVWGIKYVGDYNGMKPDEFEKAYRQKSLMGKIQVSRSRSTMETAYNPLYVAAAAHVEASTYARDSAVTDLGLSEMQDATAACAATRSEKEIFIPMANGWSRAWLRINAVLLLREQAEVIRNARAQVQKSGFDGLAQTESVVVPGAKWVVTGDASTNSISMKLIPLPKWVFDDSATCNKLFLLPPDGSKSWSFRNPQDGSRTAELANRQAADRPKPTAKLNLL